MNAIEFKAEIKDGIITIPEEYKEFYNRHCRIIILTDDIEFKKKKSDAGIEIEQQFIEDIISLYKKYNLSISHEDTHGAFVITRYSEENEDWLRQAYSKIK